MKEQEYLVVLNLGQPPEGQQRAAEHLAIHTVLHIKLVKQNLYLQGVFHALTVFIRTGLGKGNGAGQARLGQALVPYGVGGKFLLQQGVSVLSMPFRPVESILVTQEKRVRESAVRRGDLFQSQQSQPLPLLGRQFGLPEISPRLPPEHPPPDRCMRYAAPQSAPDVRTPPALSPWQSPAGGHRGSWSAPQQRYSGQRRSTAPQNDPAPEK